MGEHLTTVAKFDVLEHSHDSSDKIDRITILEALAQDLGPDDVGVSRSNHTTQEPADYDDQ